MAEETREKFEMTDADIAIREGTLRKLGADQKKRIADGKVNVAKGTMTLMVIEMLTLALREDVTVVLPEGEFFHKRFTNGLAIIVSLLSVQWEKLNDQTLWVWGRSRLSIINRAYYLANRKQFWGTKVVEVRA